MPELNDDFARELGQYESLSELENRVREHMTNRKRRSVEGETKDRLFAAMLERFQFPVPESLVQEQVDARLERGLRALAAQGMNPEQMRNWTLAVCALPSEIAPWQRSRPLFCSTALPRQKVSHKRRGVRPRTSIGCPADAGTN